MKLNFLTKDVTRIIFRVAAVLVALYFIFRLFPPSGFFLFNYPFRDYNTYPWWAPPWLADYTFWGSRYFGIASPLLALSLILVVIGIVGLHRHIKGKNQIQNQPLLILAGASAVLMLLISLTLTYFTFPNLQTGNETIIPNGWNLSLLVLVTISTVVSMVAFTGLTFNLAIQKKFAMWVVAANTIGLLILHLNWLTFFISFGDVIGGLYTVLMVLGVGWAIGLWHLGQVAVGQPVEHSAFPAPNWHKVLLGVSLLLGFWIISFVITYAWDARYTTSLCPGKQEQSDSADSSAKVINQGPGYTFTYFNNKELRWYGTKYNGTPINPDGCTLTTWAPPEWTTNTAIQQLPYGYSLIEHFAKQPTEPITRFSVNIAEADFASTADLLADLKRRQVGDRLVQQKRNQPYQERDITYNLTSINGREAVKTTGGNNGSNFHNRYESYTIIVGDDKYVVGWGVSAPLDIDIDTYIAKHRGQFQAMADSFVIK